MTLHCPTCGTELMEHGRGPCLEEWLYSVLNFIFTPASIDGLEWTIPGSYHSPDSWKDKNGKHWFRGISREDGDVYRLMQKVWEIDPRAVIYRNEIIVGIADTRNTWSYRAITGPSFPLRVIRAAIWLASVPKTLPETPAT